IVAAIILFVLPSKTNAPTTSSQGQTSTTTPAQSVVAQIPDVIVVASPTIGSAVSSTTVTIAGTARGPWYFEASFPAEILDAQGKVLAQSPAQAQGNWQTNDFVPFSVKLSYPKQPSGSAGTIVLKKDNPSGDPAHDQSLSIPVVFK
ncbi:MAG TPA: Gmad2 immunoglobulin-like domain-containing protein, partial [Candidatus Paceibacterota bacterium]|nr:Gmad2 immunoglobulin-like domain-containing protein [Candidatus Paceibacterota bacterium]